MKSNMENLNSTFKTIALERQLIDDNFNKIKLEIDRINDALYSIRMEELIEEQLTLFNLLLDRALFEVDLLGEIITTARTGIIHSSILTPYNLIEQLTKIQADLPEHGRLPVNITFEGAVDLLAIAETTLFYRKDSLIFIIKIPLTNNYDFILYHLLPFPVIVNNTDTVQFISPTMKFIAVSSTFEHYILFDDLEINLCKQTNSYKLCSGERAVYNRHERSICEIQLFFKPTIVPTTCQFVYGKLHESIFLKLKYKNTWLYATNTENIIVNCDEREVGLNTLLVGTGMISLRDDCKAITANSVLMPIKSFTSSRYEDFMPEIPLPENITRFVDKKNLQVIDLNKIKLNSYTPMKGVDNLLEEVQNNINKNTESFAINYLLSYSFYFKIFVLIIIGIIIYGIYRRKNTRNIIIPSSIPMSSL
ncbi:uncharacterized protein LOC126898514 [Daktulosphaira vitifoliae]|uniref:uncharacterized protein LOC126898514 n=1 Tax=Daktulosphaira vitifoliae TaxID=58002 RepID=UPI0021AA6317|nr:uncharacterized protein LOC126898514 [Daktulosphaira vitifoliae]